MELEDMKELWEDMSAKVASQQVVTDKIIIEMTQQKYKNKFGRMLRYETLGTVICLAAAILIMFNLDKMNTWYLMTCSIVALVFLLTLPFVTLSTLKNMKNIDMASLSNKQTLIDFAKQKKRLTIVQQFSSVFAVVLMFVTMPVFGMIFGNKDFFEREHSVVSWIFVGIVAIAVIMFSLYGYRCYKRMMDSAEVLLEEIKEAS